jgi:hypothetical protein
MDFLMKLRTVAYKKAVKRIHLYLLKPLSINNQYFMILEKL